MSNSPKTNETIYQNLFEFSPTPTAVFNVQGSCHLANRAFCTQLGFEQTELQKKVISLFELFEKVQDGKELVEQIQARGVIRRKEARLVTKEGDRFPALVSGRTLDFEGQESLEISFTNIAHQKEYQGTLRREHTRLASLIENLTAGVFLVNKKGSITEANMALGNLLGFEPDAFVSLPYLKLFAHLISMVAEPEVLQRELSRAVLNVMESPNVAFSIEEGGLKHLELTLFPVRDDAGRALGWGGLVQDITEMRAQASWKLELLSMLSHDIRSPLATLKGHATALLASHTQWSPRMVTEFLEAINRGVDQLTHQVDRNLALTRVETGRLGLRPEGVKPGRLMAQALERAAGPLENHQVITEIADTLPQVRADPSRVEEVLVNLLENAVRYSPPSQPITIDVQVTGDWVQFQIIDHGPGVPLEKHGVIFEKYVRNEVEGGGTGLGLYISRKIVEAHGGKIWVKSPPKGVNKGAAFIFTLPVMPTVEEEKLLEGRESQPSTLLLDEARFRVLVVEDETDYQILLRTILLEEGYQVEVAPDGESAVDIVRISAPDIVLMDWVLPGTSGLQVCRSIRRWSRVPIIMVTSKTAQEDLIAAFDVGVDDYITKPYQREELLARIRALLRRGESWSMEEKPDRFTAKDLVIDFEPRDVWVRGERLELTVKEFNLLAYMARHPRQVLTYNQLIENIWPDGNGSRHGLSVHISRLRKKIERDPKDPDFIGTRWGVGYVFMQ